MFSVLALSLLLAAAPVEVHTLDGAVHAGAIVELQAGRLTLEVEGVPLELAAADLLQIQPADVPAADEFVLDRTAAVRLFDGTLLYVKSFTLTGKQGLADSETLGEIRIPQTEIHSVRLAEIEPAVRNAWDNIQQRESKSDLLIIRKMDALDFVGGVVAGVDDKGVHILANNREVTAPLNRVFGLVFPRPAPVRREPVCELLLASGDRIVLKSVSIQDDRLAGQLVAGPEIDLPLAQVRNVDLGLGRVRYLADLTETAEYKPVGLITSPDVLQLRKNANSIGGALSTGGETYPRGLWLHSGATLNYRLNRDYRRLQAVIGLDDSAPACARVNPRVRATIAGDGRTLFEAEFDWNADPQSLDLDVAGIRDLVIQVAPATADTIGACEHLILAEARVIK